MPDDGILCPYCGVKVDESPVILESGDTNIKQSQSISKKKGCAIGCLGFFLLVILFGIIGNLLKEDNNGSEQQVISQEKVEKHALKIGDTFKSKAFELTITGKDNVKKVSDRSGYLYSEADGIFVVVHVHYKNISDSAKRLDNGAFQLVSDGKTYSPVTLTVRLESNIFMDTINPGIEKDGEVYFDVPESVAKSNLKLQLSSTFISDNFNGEVELY